MACHSVGINKILNERNFKLCALEATELVIEDTLSRCKSHNWSFAGCVTIESDELMSDLSDYELFKIDSCAHILVGTIVRCVGKLREISH